MMAIDTARDKPIQNEGTSFYKLSVEQYLEMFEAGILADDARVELLEGWIVNKMSKNPRHVYANELLNDWLRIVSIAGYFVNTQQPVVTEDSVPEPYLSIVKGQRTDYRSRLVAGTDVAIVVEVSDSSLRQDQKGKLRAYAQARIAEYWIVNLVDNKLEVYSEPVTVGNVATYSKHVDYQPTDEAPIVIDGQEVARLSLSELFR